MKQKHFIDTHKGLTGPFILLLIYYFNQWENINAWVYLALHGSYGIMWVLKSLIFPDKTWESKCSIFHGLYMWAGLTLYWVSPWLITSGSVSSTPIFIGCSISLFSIGVFFHFASDMQKHVHLKLKPGSLIQDGLMSKCRNMNYFGELLIYVSFAMLSHHWIPFAILASFIVIIWLPNMYRKDRSLSRHEGYVEYRKRTSFLIPFIW